MKNSNCASGLDEMLLADRVEKLLLDDILLLRQSGKLLLPHQNALAEKYAVSIRTVRTVFERLKERGFIKPVKGKGTFISGTDGVGGDIIVVCGHDTSHPYDSMLIAAVSNVLMIRGFNPVIVRVHELEGRTFSARGAIFISADDAESASAYMNKSGIPFCGINDVFEPGYFQSVSRQTVRCNNYLWAYAATDWLVRQGKDNIILFVYKNSVAYGREQIRGYTDALAKHHITFRSELIIDVPADKSSGLGDYCEDTRKFIGKEYAANSDRTGFADFSGTMTYPNSMFYHRIAEGIVRPEDVIAAEFSESPKAYLAKSMAMESLSPLITRALDIVTGLAKPFGICETHDNIVIKINENGIWKEFRFR